MSRGAGASSSSAGAPASGWVTHSTAVVHQNAWFRVRRDRVTFPSGVDGVYHVVEKPSAVVVVPMTAEGDVVVMRSYRYTLDRRCWELPAGALEPGRGVLDAAAAELAEELGGRAERMEEVGRTFLANGFARYEMHAVLARGVVLAETPRREAGEDIGTVEAVPLAVAKQRLLAPEQDGESALALLMAEPSMTAHGGKGSTR